MVKKKRNKEKKGKKRVERLELGVSYSPSDIREYEKSKQ